MASIDISEKLGKEAKTIKFSDNAIFEVDCSADKYMIMQQKLQDKEFSIQAMYDMIQELLGDGALDYVKKMNPTIKHLEVIVTAISAVVSEVSYEEMEKRFQRQ